ncbi:MAG TPA: hypothetical protein VNI54_04630 [Thermoanaerobaculia bacterium]|nr:hypothetical protein [Thermoanaerobaculia bacterium]
MHRGGTRILDAVTAPARLGSWLLVDAKPGRADAGALHMRARASDVVVETMTADAEQVLPRATHAHVLVAALDSVAVTRRLVAGSRGTAVLWQLVGRGPISSGGTCFGLAGSIAAADDAARDATLRLLDVLADQVVPASSAYLTEGGDVLAGSLLQTLRDTVSTTTVMHLHDLVPMSSTLTLAFPNDTIPAHILDWRDGERVHDTVQRVASAVRRPPARRCGTVLVDAHRGRLEFWRIDTTSEELVGLIEFDPAPTPDQKAIVTD